MLQPSQIDLATLPAVALAERATLPDCPAIYFALAADDTVLYIGKARRLVERWKSTIHHRYAQLAAMGDIRLAWLSVSDETLLNAIEQACIEYFAPALNSTIVPHRTATMCRSELKWKVRQLSEQRGFDTAYKLALAAGLTYNMGVSAGVKVMAKKVVSKAKQLRLNMAARLGRDVTLKEVYAATGIAMSTLSRIENNQVQGIDFATLAKIAEFYEVTNTSDVLSLEDVRRARRLAPERETAHQTTG